MLTAKQAGLKPNEKAVNGSSKPFNEVLFT